MFIPNHEKMKKIIKPKYVILEEIELQGHDEKELFTVLCYDGHATAFSEKGTTFLTYPKRDKLTADECIAILDYRGLPRTETIGFDDVMMKFGKEKE